jgi:hypothetical protein
MRDEAAAPLLASLSEEERFGTWHLALPDGAVPGGGPAALALIDELAPPLTRVAECLPVDAAYRLVSRNRTLLGRFVPDTRVTKRFP